MIPSNLISLHAQEEQLREKCSELIASDMEIQLHLQVIEQSMNIADLLRQYPADDEDTKVIQILGMRIFNALGAALKLSMSGYQQNAAILLRDVMETMFLVDLFGRDRKAIKNWRYADKKTRINEFSPASVRKRLDKLDGFHSQKRKAHYDLFSELAAHPTMKSAWMMRPHKNGDAVIGPFMELTSLKAVLAEMGQLAIMSGQSLVCFYPKDWEPGLQARYAFLSATAAWATHFFPGRHAT